MKKRGKRGLSPVIATALLIVISLVLAVIIFFWARSFIGEGLEKEGRVIESACGDVAFSADATATDITVENTGNVPIYGIEIRKVGAGEEITQAEDFSSTVTNGQTVSVALPSSLVYGDDIMVVPVLLGEKGSQTGTHTCDADYGVEISVT